MLSAESAAEPGRWKCIPYQRGMMDAVTDPDVETISIMKSARVGYTKMLNATIGYHAHQDPCPILLVQPTIEDAKGYSKDELAPMFRDVPALRGSLSDAYRDGDNTLLKKMFPGGSIALVGANSQRGFRRITVRIVLMDEIDGYPEEAGDEGDQLTLAKRRSDTYWNRKVIHGSTPTIAGVSRIERLFLESDQRRYYVPCPHCGRLQVLVWGQMKWPEGDPLKAWYECGHCAEPIDHQWKREMVAAGEWRSEAPFTGHAGFHIWAAYSFSPNATWGKLAAEWSDANADRVKRKNHEKLKTFINTVIGEPWTDQGEQVTWSAIYNRRERYRAAVPNGSVLTGGVDVQDDRLEYEIVAWGDGEESWSVEVGRLIGDPGREEVWNTLHAKLSRTWLRADGVQLDVRLVCVDSGGHYTDEVYGFSRRHGVRWAVPTKGSSEQGKPIAMFPRQLNRKRVYLTMLGTDTAKELLARRLSSDEPGPGFCHFPDRPEYDEEYFEQLCSEKAVTKYRNGRPHIEWIKTRARNEALDLRILALAAVRILQQHGGITLESIDEEDHGGDGGGSGGEHPSGSPRAQPDGLPRIKSQGIDHRGSWFRRR